MKKYQLMGRRKVASPKSSPKYPLLHLHSLPYEILLAIFSQLPLETLLQLSLLCAKFHQIVSKNFVYQDVFFKLTSQFLRFAGAHLSLRASLARRFGLNEPSSMINYIRKVHFKNPPTNDIKATLTNIAGSYSVENVSRSTSKYDAWVTSFKCLLNEAYGLKEVTISEISPQFGFPPEFMVASTLLLTLKLTLRRQVPSRSLEKLTLTAQLGWTIPFKLCQMLLFAYAFDHISELQLNKFVINVAKLLSDSWEKKLVVDSLVASACIYSDAKKAVKRRCINILAYTHLLLLLDIHNAADLSLIDFVKLNGRLLRLVIDISSKVFFTSENANKTFNFAKFNNFFKLVCSGQGGYSDLREIVLVNFDLFHDFSHQHNKAPLDVIREDSELASLEEVLEDDWVEPSRNTFEYFLRYLLQMPNLTIVIKERPKVMHTCVKCGFTLEEATKKISTLAPHEWAIILAPVLCQTKCTVNIYDHTWTALYSRKGRQGRPDNGSAGIA